MANKTAKTAKNTAKTLTKQPTNAKKPVVKDGRTVEKSLKTPITGSYINRQQLAWLFCVSTRAVHKWLEESNPIPSQGTGHSRQFSIHEAINWYHWYENNKWNRAKESRNPKKGDAPDKVESERRLAHFKAENERLKLAKQSREYVPAELFYSIFAGIIAQLRTDALSIANRIRGEFGDAVYNRVGDIIKTMLTNLGNKVKNVDDIHKLTKPPVEDND